MIAVARETGQPAFVPFAFMVLAWVRMLRGELADGAETLDAAIEEARLLGNTQSWPACSSTVPSPRWPRRSEAAAATARESVASPRGWTTDSSGRRDPVARRRPAREGDPGLGDAVELMVRRCEGRASLHAGRQLPHQVARAPDQVLAALDRRAEATRRLPTRRPSWTLGRTPDGYRDGRTRSGSRRLDAGDPTRRPGGRSPQRPLPIRSASRWRRRCRESWPAEPSPVPIKDRVPSRSSNGLPSRCTTVAP